MGPLGIGLAWLLSSLLVPSPWAGAAGVTYSVSIALAKAAPFTFAPDPPRLTLHVGLHRAQPRAQRRHRPNDPFGVSPLAVAPGSRRDLILLHLHLRGGVGCSMCTIRAKNSY
jgi:hypothetical protein